ncbi:MAG: tRNA uridine-5-carboxymethylaminomethyl(34) synthesis GTPase MnmE [Hoeflea sp.]|uniref:tRNA uridine-5-carboxymethylaminomethyl(34) synthesis GTPase MnmE n=1 Tax=Hoeflea sp. TaxID=1940281 RepID=UPI0032EEA71C
MPETIFALSSGSVPSGVAVIRISGPKVRFGLETLVGFVPAARHASLCVIRNDEGVVLDKGLALYFPGPNSFTGEDVAELQIHGSPAAVQAVLSALGQLAGYRAAERGEFTRQAFANGKMDLTEVEGLADLLVAETEAQRRQALSQVGGGLRALYQDWAKRLTHARAMIEAELDFSDEDDIPGSVSDRIWSDMKALLEDIRNHLAKASYGEIVRTGFKVALIGPPNAGKSSLLNCLAGRDVAIVADTPGTTRDVVEVRLDLNGYLVTVQDTAGLRDDSDDAVELEGMRRSRMVAENADLVLDLRDVTTADPDESRIGAMSIRVWTKIDRLPASKPAIQQDIGISSKTGDGIDSLISAILDRIVAKQSNMSEVVPSRGRHVALLQSACSELDTAVGSGNVPIEVRAEYLRRAADDIGRITGKVDVEDLLGVIFSEFCVGK